MSMNIPVSGYCFSFSTTPYIDSEEKAIMDRLLAYGITPTGNKTTDKAKLRRVELEKAKQDNYVSNKYVTVSQAECQRIQDNKKQKKEIANPDQSPKFQDKRQGAKILGEQVFLSIKMKQDYENRIIDSDDKKYQKKVS